MESVVHSKQKKEEESFEHEDENKSQNLSIVNEKDISSFLKDATNMLTSYITETWGPLFSESEKYERVIVERTESMMEEITQRENDLAAQKRNTIEKLNLVSRSLNAGSTQQH